jgi:hypothetical protein
LGSSSSKACAAAVPAAVAGRHSLYVETHPNSSSSSTSVKLLVAYQNRQVLAVHSAAPPQYTSSSRTKAMHCGTAALAAAVCSDQPLLLAVLLVRLK